MTKQIGVGLVLVFLGAASAFANNVKCNFSFKANESVSQAQKLEVVVPLNCEGRATVKSDATKVLGDFQFQVTADGAILVGIQDRYTGTRITSLLYQFGPGFSGYASNPGVTGLHYTYHPTTASELQWSCGVYDIEGAPISELPEMSGMERASAE